MKMSYGEVHWKRKQPEVLPCVSVSGPMMSVCRRVVWQAFRGIGMKPPDSFPSGEENCLRCKTNPHRVAQQNHSIFPWVLRSKAVRLFFQEGIYNFKLGLLL